MQPHFFDEVLTTMAMARSTFFSDAAAEAEDWTTCARAAFNYKRRKSREKL